MKIMISLSAELALDRAEIKKLERDPEKYAKWIHTTDLAQVIRWLNRLYYVEHQSPVSDGAYDVLRDELAERKPDHPLLKQVDAPIPKGRKKVPLPYPMFSLDKIKPGTPAFNQWRTKFKGPYVISDKEDGNSLELIYDNGVPSRAITRGKNQIGQDVSHIIPYLKIPKKVPVKHLVVRGEVIMTEAAFNSKFSKDVLGKKDGFDNARNLVGGAINKISEKHIAWGSIDFIAYEIIEPRKLKTSAAFAKLKQMGFQTAWNKVVPDISSEMLSKLLIERKQKSPYAIDGLVVEADRINKRPPASAHHPDYAVAFKMTSEDDIQTVTVKDVVWEESKHGAWKPRVNIPPTRLGGVTVDYATGFNAFFIKNGFRLKQTDAGLPVRPIGPGAQVRVTRSGDVIPHIIEVVKGAKVPALPKAEFKWKGADIYSTQESDTTRNKRLTAFFATVGIENIKLGTVQQLVAAGLDTVAKIIKAGPADFKAIEGFQDKKAQKLYDSIHAKLDSIPLPSLMDASGQFPAGIGTKRATMVLKVYPNILKFAAKSPKVIARNIAKIPGFKDNTALQFATGLPKFVAWLKKTGIKPVMPKKVKVAGSKMQGQAVCFTGVRNADLEKQIVQQGGTIATGVNSKTTILIAKDKDSGSSKNAKAQELGIPIYTMDEFVRKFKL